MRVGETHVHSFELNWVPSERRMKGRLPCAEPIDPEPQGFEELREYVGNLLRISNIKLVPRPNWDYDLFNEYSERDGQE